MNIFENTNIIHLGDLISAKKQHDTVRFSQILYISPHFFFEELTYRPFKDDDGGRGETTNHTAPIDTFCSIKNT